SLHPELPGPEEPIVEFPEGKVGVYTKLFEFANFRIPISQFLIDILDERIFLTVVEWHINAPKDKMPSADSYSAADVTALNTHLTPIQKQPKTLLRLVGLSQSYFLGDDVYPRFLYDDDRDMDLFNLISASNPTKVKIGTRPRAAHEVPLLTATASRVIDMKDTTVASGSSGIPFALEKSPLDFANEDPPQLHTERDGTKDQVQDGSSHEIPLVENATTTEVVLEPDLEKEEAAMMPLVNKRRRKRGNDEAEANAPPKVLRKDHATFRPAQSTLGGKSLASMGLDEGSIFFMPATEDVPTAAKSVSDPDPLSYAKPQPHPERDIAQSSRKTTTEIPTENVATTEVQGMFSAEEAKLLKKATAKIAKQDQRIQVREKEIKKLDQEIKSLRAVEAEVHDLHNQTKNLESLLEAEVDMKKAAEAKNAKLAKELESLRVQFSDL
ncbi:hypothetical protein Tco_0153381, partial [Tanacetum coccineum]